MSSKSTKKWGKTSKSTKREPEPEEYDDEPLLDDDYDDNDGVDLEEINVILSKQNDKANEKKQKEQDKKANEEMKKKKLEEKIIKEEVKSAKESDKDPQERATLMLMIEKRKALFPQQCTSLNVTNSMSNEEIRNKIHEVDIRISNKNAMSITKHMIDGVASGTEKFGPLIGYDFTGLAAYVNEDPIMTDLANEMSLKYDSYRQFPVEMRFLFAFSGGALAIHRRNTGKRVSQIAANINNNNASDL